MSLPGVALSVMVDGLDHPEGLALSPSGHLWAGGEAGQIYRIDPESAEFEEVATTGGFLLGVTVDGDGLVYVCDVKNRQVSRYDPESGELSVYSRGTAERPMINPNWAAFDSAGNLYCTDSGTWKGDDGWIWLIAPGGAARVWSTESSNFPNGCCMAADQRSLLVLESLTPALVRIPINADGSAGKREVLVELPGTVPDGVSLDTDGNAYICCYRPDRILRVDPAGAVEVIGDDPQGTLLAAPTNSAWFGPELTRCACPNLGRWHLTEIEVPGARGLPLNHPRLRSVTG